MKLSDFIPSGDTLKLIQGIEGRLRQRKKVENVSVIIAVAAAIIQLLLDQINKNLKDIHIYLLNFFDFINLLLHRKWDIAVQYRPVYELAGLFVVVVAFVMYVFLKRTKFLLKYSEEPFRYTFWVAPFKHTKDMEKKSYNYKENDRFHHLLHHDLMEKLSKGIRRLSLLDTGNLGDDAKKNLTSHIDIEGHYTIRKDEDKKWVLQVMPRIRIGAPHYPATLANPVEFKLDDFSNNLSNSESIGSEKYKQIVERIYSSVATQIYWQIKSDLKEKIQLFPTNYLRAVALFYEAEDFARSNTIDAYDLAIELYRESLRFFDTVNVKPITNILIKFPFLLWRKEIAFQHMMAKVELGYAKCLIYRRQISALSGKYKNPLFETRKRIDQVIYNLCLLHKRMGRRWKLSMPFRRRMDANGQELRRNENRFNNVMRFLTFQSDSWKKYFNLRTWQILFDTQKRLLFEAYVISSLTYYYMKSIQRAKDYLDDARAVAPALSESYALFLFAQGAIEPNINKKIQLLRRTIETAPDFQIAQYLLAYYFEIQFRIQNEINEDRAMCVIDEYEKVLKINPGNIAAIASQGYIYWLTEKEATKAKEIFKRGFEIKAVSQQTYVGELSYGLARISAERGDFNECFNYLTESCSADEGVGAYSTKGGKFTLTPFYDSIDTEMLERYRKYRENVEQITKHPIRSNTDTITIRNKDGKEITVSSKTIRRIHSFVLNDYGNACVNYYIRFGDCEQLDNAIQAYEEAIKQDKQNSIVYFNLYFALGMREKVGDKLRIDFCFNEAVKMLDPISLLVILLAKDRLKRERDNIVNNLRTLWKVAQPTIAKEREATSLFEILLAKDRLKRERDNIVNNLRTIWKVDQPTIAKEREATEKLIYKLFKKNLPDAIETVRKIVMETKLSSIFQRLESDKSSQELMYYLSKIKADVLNESDVEALMVWADVLSNNVLNVEEQNEALKLYDYLQEMFLPDNFDLNMSLYRLYEIKKIKLKASIGKESEKRRRELEKCDKGLKVTGNIVKSAAINWHEQDPMSYAPLTWISDGDFFEREETIRYLTEAIEEDPRNAAKQNLLGNVHYLSERYEESLQYYRKAIELSPDIAVYHANLSGSHRALKSWEEAEKALREAVKIEPDNAAYWNYLGNVHYGSERYEESLQYYSKAIELSPDIAVYHANLSGSHRALKNWKEAEKALREAVEIEPDNTDYWNYLGNMYYESERYEESLQYYNKAIELSPETAVYHANLSNSWEKIKEPGNRFNAIENALKAMQKAHDLAPDDESYKRSLSILELKKYFIPYYDENILEMAPVVNPIAIEVSADLTPLVEDEKKSGFPQELSELLATMRDGILDRYGVRIPGILFKGKGADFPNRTYVIMLMEVPIESGHISLDKRLYLGTEEKLKALGVVGEEHIVPFTGDRAFWISQGDWELLEKEEVKLWKVIEYPMRHLEMVLQRNLSEFIGHQEVMNILKAEDSEVSDQIRKSSKKLTDLTQVLKGLVSEQVSIKSLSSILDSFIKFSPDKNLIEVMEEIRSLPHICSKLPGNDSSYRFLTLGIRFEKAVEKSIYTSNLHPVLALEPALCQDLLTTLRNKITSYHHVAILVKNGNLRPFVRKLTELEFPDIPVLTLSELLPSLKNKIVGEIELRNQRTFENIDLRNHEIIKEKDALAKTAQRKNKSKELEEPIIKLFVNSQFTKMQSEADDQPLNKGFDFILVHLLNELGIILPKISINVDDKLLIHEFRMQLHKFVSPPIEGLKPDEFMVNNTVEKLLRINIQGRKAVNPASGAECAIVQETHNFLEQCRKAGLQTMGPSGFIIFRLLSEIRKRADSFLTERVVQYRLDMLSTEFPDLVNTVFDRFSAERLTLILRNLLEEEISIRDLRSILESLLSINGTTDVDLRRFMVFVPNVGTLCLTSKYKSLDTLDIVDYSDCVRMSLKRYISHKYAIEGNTIVVYLLNPSIESRIKESGERPLSGEERKQLLEAVRAEVGNLPPTAKNPVILTNLQVRKLFWELIKTEFPYLAVLSYQELLPDMTIQTIARISLS